MPEAVVKATNHGLSLELPEQHIRDKTVGRDLGELNAELRTDNLIDSMGQDKLLSVCLIGQ